jgi:hypothetical protein
VESQEFGPRVQNSGFTTAIISRTSTNNKGRGKFPRHCHHGPPGLFMQRHNSIGSTSPMKAEAALCSYPTHATASYCLPIREGEEGFEADPKQKCETLPEKELSKKGTGFDSSSRVLSEQA